MFLKNHDSTPDEVSGQLISLGGTRMEDGRTWGYSQDLMSRTFKISDSNIVLDKLTSLKTFQVTSSHKNSTSKGSSTPGLTNAAFCDLEPPTSNIIRAIVYGGQKVDTGLTSDEVIKIEGEIHENINESSIDITRYPAEHKHYSQFGVPAGWPDGSHLVQLGDIPTSRTGSRLSFVRKIGSSDLLISIGGHCKENYLNDYFHPQESIHLLLVPEMRWWQLEANEHFQRSFHSQTLNSEGEIFLLGGMSLKNGHWAIIHPLTEIVKIRIKDDFTYVLTTIDLISDLEAPSFITNFSFCGLESSIFIFGGFNFPEYSSEEENLYKFQPPNASRNKLPKFSDSLFKIDLVEGKLRRCTFLEESGAYNGSLVPISQNGSKPELIIHADPKVILYTERALDNPVCDLPEDFGSCSLGIVDKNTESYDCSTPVCNKFIHLKCDKSLRGKVAKNPFCPSCRNLNPESWKPYPGTRRPRRK